MASFFDLLHAKNKENLFVELNSICPFELLKIFENGFLYYLEPITPFARNIVQE